MAEVALSGSDVFTLNNRIFTGLADGNSVEVTFDNDMATAKTGKGGNSIYGENTMGEQATVKLRLLRGTADDKFMNGLVAQQRRSFAAFPLMVAEHTKNIGDGLGKITADTTILGGGVFIRRPDGKTNSEGDTEQSVSLYTLRFTTSPRALT